MTFITNSIIKNKSSTTSRKRLGQWALSWWLNPSLVKVFLERQQTVNFNNLEAPNGGTLMKCRKNVRKLIQEYNAASATNKPNTALVKFRQAVVDLKAAPSKLPAPHTQLNRYDDYVYIHQQSMASDPAHPMPADGPHPGHRSPMFFPWHREFLRQFENDLRIVSSDPSICLPYWDFSRDQSSADLGYPFIDDFLGGNGVGANNVVQTGVFAQASGWTLNLGASNALQRQFGVQTPSLPTTGAITGSLTETTYDSAPFDRTVAGSDSFRNLVEGWVGPQSGPNIHNRVHVWVGGSMLPSTSPNDPVFFLNHCKEDELWAVWMQKYSTVPHYLPDDSYSIPPAQHHLKRLSDNMESLAEYFGAGTIDRPIDLLDHKAIVWYDTDLPEITLESGPAIAFNNVPAGLTIAKRIRFRVRSCRTVFFSITGAPSGNFSIVSGPDFPVTPIEANDFEILEIEVRFLGQGSNVQVSAVDIQAYVIDEEGYYATNPNDPFVVQNFHIELVANNIITSDSSIALVLDRSGSMSDVANSGFTKSQLLKSAVGIVHELMKDTDQIGIARFDHESDVLLPMTSASSGLGTTLTGLGLDPRGATSIGSGILVGSGLINGSGATQPNKALVVLTDGNENTAPLISALPPGTINQTTFAIGFGLPGQVSDPILNQISANTGGYLLVTGNMTNNDERFRLAKFFIQILKDATLNQTVVDPEGQLLWNGQPQEIPFQVSDSDVSIDVVTLCPLPFALDFQLITPGGQTIILSDSGVEPNVRYVLGSDVAYYRLMLPVFPNNTSGSHRGQWKAILQLRKLDAVLEYLQKAKENRVNFAEMIRRLREFAEKPVPFNLTVYAYSNLTLDVTLRQDSFAPGATVHLTAKLWEYQVPLQNPAVVWADVLQPDGSRVTLPFSQSADGAFHADWLTSRPGIYQFVIRAEGNTTGNARFSREKILTAGVWAGGDQPYNPQTGTEGPAGCEWMICMLEALTQSRELRKRLEEIGIDIDTLRKCVEEHCRKEKPRMTEGRRSEIEASDELLRLSQLPEFQRFIAGFMPSGIRDMPLLEAATTVPVVRKPKMEGSDENMFVLPEWQNEER
ncbi:tyrosinase family protein [Leptolyngbyaceae cyanobacterium UHCC 1019]